MEKRLPKRAMHQFVPFDVPRYAKKFLKHFRPDAVLWFESELWPAMLSEIKKNNIPLIYQHVLEMLFWIKVSTAVTS